MRINERFFPTIIIVTFVLFLLIGILLGFKPSHGSGGSDGKMTSTITIHYADHL